jgi:hypothetical protein
LKASPEGAKTTVHGIVPALRTYMRPRFDPATGRQVSPRLVFLHFMKVGGTSLSDLFAQWFSPEDARVHMFLDDVALTPAPILASYRVLAGHIPYCALPLIPASFKTLVVLRDPVSRTVSHYLTLRSAEPAYADLTLDRFVADDTFDALCRNYQARYLAHDIDIARAWREYSPEWLVASTGGEPSMAYPLAALFDSGPVSDPEDALLEKAAGNLETIDYIGTTDDLSRVARLVADLFGRPSADLWAPRLNVSAPFDTSQLGARTLNQIEEKNSVDIELYRMARALSAGI